MGAAFALGLLAPAFAGARPFVSLDAALGLGDGLHLYLGANGAPGPDKPALAIWRSVGEGSEASLYYAWKGDRATSGRRIAARLGTRGSAHLVHPTGKRRVSSEGSVVQAQRAGVLRGSLRFRGERRFVKVRAHRLRAVRSRTVFRARCMRRSAPPLWFFSCAANGSTLDAQRWGDAVLFDGEGPLRTKRGLASMNSVTVTGPGSSLAPSSHLRRATISPPTPFSGQATFEKPKATGDLAMPRLGFDHPLPLMPANARLKRANEIGCRFPQPDGAGRDGRSTLRAGRLRMALAPSGWAPPRLPSRVP